MPSVRLNVHEHTSYDRQFEPVTSGIPWPRGTLRDTSTLRLVDQRGKALPLQASPLAYWPDGSIKWSLLTTRLNATGGKITPFRLDAPDRPVKARPRSTGKRLKLTRGRQSIVIDTGVMRLTVDTRNGGFITEVRTRNAKGQWVSLVQPGGIHLYVNRCDPDGGNRQSFTNGPDAARDRRTQPQPPPDFTNNAVDPAYAVTVIEEGPERVGLRIGGTHVNSKGHRFCPYVVYLYAYRDSTRLDVHHTLIYTGVPQQDLIAGFGIDVPLRLAKAGRRYHFAEDAGPGIETKVQPTPAHPQWLHGRLTQLAATAYRADKWTGPDCGPVKIIEGERNQGWARLGDARVGCLAAVRDFWQQYPKAFEVDAQRGSLSVELWPSSGAPWDLRRYSHECHGELYEYTPRKLGPVFPEASHGARGISKTHEVALWFEADPPAGRQELARRALGFTQPLMLMADPAWYCDSGAVGAVAPHDPKRFPHPERTVTDYIDFMLTERERNKWYGMVDYGDLQMTHAQEDYNVPTGTDNPEDTRWLYDIGGHAWINAEHRPDQGLWLTFFRTGRPDYFEAAAAMTRHNRDLDVYHWGNFKGSGTRHNVNHWGCADKEWRVSNPISMRWHYYLTGNGWTREAMDEAIQTYQSYRDIETSSHTSGGALLCGMLAKAERSGSAADLQALTNLADVYADMVSPLGNVARRMRVDALTGNGSVVGERDPEGRLFFLLGFGCMQTLVEVAELLNHKALSDALVRHADSRARKLRSGASEEKGGPSMLHVQVFSHAWRRTGDRRYLAFIRRTLTAIKTVLTPRGSQGGCLERPPHRVPVRGKKQTCWMLADIGVQSAFGMKALVEAGAKPRGR